MTDTVENLELEIIRLRAELAKAKEYANSVSQEAADLITRYCNERDKLRWALEPALEPFAKSTGSKIVFTSDDLRHARAVYEETGENNGI